MTNYIKNKIDNLIKPVVLGNGVTGLTNTKDVNGSRRRVLTLVNADSSTTDYELFGFLSSGNDISFYMTKGVGVDPVLEASPYVGGESTDIAGQLLGVVGDGRASPGTDRPAVYGFYGYKLKKKNHVLTKDSSILDLETLFGYDFKDHLLLYEEGEPTVTGILTSEFGLPNAAYTSLPGEPFLSALGLKHPNQSNENFIRGFNTSGDNFNANFSIPYLPYYSDTMSVNKSISIVCNFVGNDESGGCQMDIFQVETDPHAPGLITGQLFNQFFEIKSHGDLYDPEFNIATNVQAGEFLGMQVVQNLDFSVARIMIMERGGNIKEFGFGQVPDETFEFSDYYGVAIFEVLFQDDGTDISVSVSKISDVHDLASFSTTGTPESNLESYSSSFSATTNIFHDSVGFKTTEIATEYIRSVDSSTQSLEVTESLQGVELWNDMAVEVDDPGEGVLMAGGAILFGARFPSRVFRRGRCIAYPDKIQQPASEVTWTVRTPDGATHSDAAIGDNIGYSYNERTNSYVGLGLGSNASSPVGNEGVEVDIEI